jgi:hypothetical protein
MWPLNLQQPSGRDGALLLRCQRILRGVPGVGGAVLHRKEKQRKTTGRITGKNVSPNDGVEHVKNVAVRAASHGHGPAHPNSGVAIRCGRNGQSKQIHQPIANPSSVQIGTRAAINTPFPQKRLPRPSPRLRPPRPAQELRSSPPTSCCKSLSVACATSTWTTPRTRFVSHHTDELRAKAALEGLGLTGFTYTGTPGIRPSTSDVLCKRASRPSGDDRFPT